jgi:hypothetical protein
MAIPIPSPAQAGVEIAREGLPYWIAWLLLSVILLLAFFIFLRDRDLRNRVNEFLSGAKKRVKRAQLGIRLNREKKRRIEALNELGRQAWRIGIPGEAYDVCKADIARLEQTGRAKQADLQGTLTRALDLRKKLDEARGREKALRNLEETGGHPDGREVQGLRDESRRLKKEIRACERDIRSGQAELHRIDDRKSAAFIELGNRVDEARPESPDLLGLYVQIDKRNRIILHYMNELEKFR